MAISRYYRQPLPIRVKFRKHPLAAYGLDYDAIEDIAMNFKLALATDADDAYLEKKQSTAGVTLDAATHTFTLLLTEDDYANLAVGKTYNLTLNIKVVGIGDYLELEIADRAVLITADTNRA